MKSVENRNIKINILIKTQCDIICAQGLRLTTQEDVNKTIAIWAKGTAIISIGYDKADGICIFFKTKTEIIESSEIIPGRALLVDFFYVNIK